jgi:hypothetical protein
VTILRSHGFSLEITLWSELTLGFVPDVLRELDLEYTIAVCQARAIRSTSPGGCGYSSVWRYSRAAVAVVVHTFVVACATAVVRVVKM